MTDKACPTGILAALGLTLSAPALATEGVEIKELIIAAPNEGPQRDATVRAVRAFYDLWNTGDETLLKQAIAENFTDRTLPPGRPQGPEGPAFASRQYNLTLFREMGVAKVKS